MALSEVCLPHSDTICKTTWMIALQQPRCHSLSFWWPVSFKRPRRATIRTKKCFYHQGNYKGFTSLMSRGSCHSGNYNSLRSSVSGTGTKTCIYIYYHSTFTHTDFVLFRKERTGLHYLWNSEYSHPTQSSLFSHLDYPPIDLLCSAQGLKSWPSLLPLWQLRPCLDS